MSFRNSNFEGNFSTSVFSKSFWHNRELKIECWTLRHILCKKNIISFVCLEVINLVVKWNVYEDHIFPRPLLQTCRLDTTSLCLNTRLTVNKKFPNSHYFYWINVNVSLLRDHHIMKSIILHTRRTFIKKYVTHLVFRFQLIFFFAIWGDEKHVFHIVPFRPLRYALKSLKCLEVSNRIRNWDKVKNNIYVMSKLLLCQLEVPIFINKSMCHSSLINSIWIVFCELNRVANRNEGKSVISDTINFSNSQIETLVSYSRSTNFNVNMSFPNSNFKGNISIYCLASHFVIIESWKT